MLYTKPRLLTPGPTSLPDQVRLAMAQDMLHHRKANFKSLFSQVQKGLQTIFGTKQAVLSLSCSGTGAMVAAATNLFTTGQKVLVVKAGYFGERWEEICRKTGLEVTSISLPWGQTVEAKDLEAVLEKHPTIQGVFVQHSETSTGAQHPVQEIAAITRKRNVLLVVDGISSVSIAPCPMDAWGIDCLVSSSQKGFLVPPGLAFLALSPRAWDRAEKIISPNTYFDLCAEKKEVLNGQTAFTPSISLFLGLAESLRIFEKMGLANIYEKQWALTHMVRQGIHAMGLELFVRKNYAWGLTSVILPPSIQASHLVHLAAEHYNVIFATGQGALKEKIVRFGHMGWVDYGDALAGLYALAESYKRCGGAVTSNDFLNQATKAYAKAQTQFSLDSEVY